MIKGPMNRLPDLSDVFFKKVTTNSNSARDQQWKPNVTVAAIIERDGKFLMVEEFSHGRMVFNQPAGHLEEGETLFQAVEREVREETAWGFKPEIVTGVYMHPSPSSHLTYLRFSFAGTCHDHDPEQALDDGIQRAVWMTVDELQKNIEKLRSPIVLSSINDYLQGNSMPLDCLKYQLPQSIETN